MTTHLHLAADRSAAVVVPHADPIRVVLADDHTRVRRSLRLLLDQEEGIDVVVDASDLGNAIRQVYAHAPHVLVLDLQMPGGSSIETIRQIRASSPATEVVVMTLERSPAFAARALGAGASGYVLTDRADVDLPLAVRLAAGGQTFISANVAASLDALRRSVEGDGLSPRESEVLRLIALGYTSAEIGRHLHVSRRTIDSHRANLHRKLGLATRAELVQFALSRGLVAQ